MQPGIFLASKAAANRAGTTDLEGFWSLHVGSSMFEPDLRGCNSGRWIETGF